MIILQVILPVSLIFLIGYVGQKILRLEIKSISAAALYLMNPFLVFRGFYENKLDSTYLYIIIYGVVLSVIIIGLIKVLAKVLGYGDSVTSGLILSTAFMNNGNLGAPLILFAFGQKAFQYAVAIMVFHTIVMSTLGIYYAAKGRSDMRKALFSVVKMPVVHAVFIGLLWQYLHLTMPANMNKAIDMVADASIPVIMLVLGMQLAEIKIINPDRIKIALALFTRLLVSPVIALGITLALPVEPLLGKVMIVEAAMPSAAITTMYALQFDSEPELVSSITFIGTLFSMLTLSILLTIIR